jgi:hypothetical protein
MTPHCLSHYGMSEMRVFFAIMSLVIVQDSEAKYQVIRN